ncbi:head GIN domain-containing protein [uncultured Hymenobacter sp.]|uniref:head GIN domain-containing protein n=1 Tax=uncultured Hymenobacter sp. TaxID=170016 RepID=UPI0035CA5004
MKNLLTLALLWLLALAAPALAQTPFEVRPVDTFSALEVSSGIELHLTAGPTPRVEVSADTPELQARIKTEVSGGVLRVSFEQTREEQRSRQKTARHLRVNVTAPPLTALRASSGATIAVAGSYSPEKLEIDLSSGAVLTADLTAPAVQAHLSSGGIATLTGQIQRLDVRAASGGIFKGSGLQAATCQAEASSGGIITVGVEKTLTAEASSGGGVRYTGSPQVTKRTSSGGHVSSR